MTVVRNAVCLCADARMLIPAFFVADSVRKTSACRGSSFDVIVFAPSEDLTETHRQWAAGRGIELCDDLDVSPLLDIKILKRRFSTATLMRLLVPDHLAGRYQKILQLDADLTIHGDVSVLFKLEMNDFAIAAVPGRIWTGVSDEGRDWWWEHFKSLGMTSPKHYFNAGVMLIDVENWRRDNLASRALDFIRQNQAICAYPDEDALNALLDGNLLELSPIWNTRPSRSFGLGSAVRPVIVHYAGPLKPWKRFARRKRLFDGIEAYRLYQEFVRETPWPHWLKEHWTGRDFLACLRHEARSILEGLRSDKELAEKRRLFEVEQRQCYAEAKFADVQQAVAVNDNGILRLATNSV